MNKETVLVGGAAKIRAFGWLRMTAKFALHHAERSAEGQFHNAMTTIVFSAFAIEAYFNDLGPELFDDWMLKERKFSKRKKLNKFLAELSIEAELTKRPYKSVFDSFDFRDTLAHGRTEQINKELVMEIEDYEPGQIILNNDWMEFCTVENARRIFDDVMYVIEELHVASGRGQHPFLSSYSGSYGIQSID